MAKLILNAGIIAITALLSTHKNDMEKIRTLGGEDLFFEVHVECPAEVCAERDPKGLYEKAKRGIVKDLTGISAPYEPHENLYIIIRSDKGDAATAAKNVPHLLIERQINS